MKRLPYPTVVTPDLPSIRVSDSPPFSHTGIDYVGPLYTHSKNSDATNVDKVYLCVSMCASTRSVHLELAPDLSVESFCCYSNVLLHAKVSRLH